MSTAITRKTARKGWTAQPPKQCKAWALLSELGVLDTAWITTMRSVQVMRRDNSRKYMNRNPHIVRVLITIEDP